LVDVVGRTIGAGKGTVFIIGQPFQVFIGQRDGHRAAERPRRGRIFGDPAARDTEEIIVLGLQVCFTGSRDAGKVFQGVDGCNIDPVPGKEVLIEGRMPGNIFQ
jgi:hypothetical protein